MKSVAYRLLKKYYQRFRIWRLKAFWDNPHISKLPLIRQPVLFTGNGKIIFGDNVQLGYYPSPHFYDGSIHIEARSVNAIVKFGSNIYCNNNLTIVCDKTKISIGNSVLIGTNVSIFDSDFHEISPVSRNNGNQLAYDVVIEDNVFIGSNVTILKGVVIGKNSIIANGAIVTNSFPQNVIIGGNPAKIIKSINL